MSATISLEVPDFLVENYKDKKELEKNILENTIIREYQKGNLSIREAAETLHLTYEGFMEWLGERKISFISASKEELEEDYLNFKKFLSKHQI